MKAWHFVGADRRMSFGDKRLVEVGKTYSVEGEPVLCEHGLHGSERIIDALYYAPGPVVCRVRLSGILVHGKDKSVATQRTVLGMIDATEILEALSRQWALSVAHLWPMPDVLREFLKTGEESLRAAAWAAAWEAARQAARAAAWAAAGAAARETAQAAAWAAALEEALIRQNAQLEARVLAELGTVPSFNP